MMDSLKRFDAYPRVIEDFRVRTISGAISTFCLFGLNLC